MVLESPAKGTNLIDVLDRVLDKGIVIDAWMRVSLVGLNLLEVEARIVVASIETYRTHAESLSRENTLALSSDLPDIGHGQQRNWLKPRVRPRAA